MYTYYNSLSLPTALPIWGEVIGFPPADGNSRDARRGEPRGDIGGDVEHRMAGLARGEEAFVGGIVGEEMLNEAVVDLVGGASDARADRRSDMGAARAEAFHRVQRRIGDPGERALPARVRGADGAGLAVGAQHATGVRG